jgi:hypothetical protein
MMARKSSRRSPKVRIGSASPASRGGSPPAKAAFTSARHSSSCARRVSRGPPSSATSSTARQKL